MVICLVYIGVIVMLHIFGKVKSQATTPNFPTPEPEFEEQFEDPGAGDQGDL